MKIQTFIFNWRGQYENTLFKIKQLKEIGIEPIIINSDDNHKEKDWHNIGESAYFTDQMLAALNLFDADVMFHIQADASYDRWSDLINDARKYFEEDNWGIYAPNVDYTWYDSTRTDLDAFVDPESKLKMVANTDCTCWFIHRDIIEKAKSRNVDFSPYKMGWSFDIVYPALSHMMQRPVLRDYAHTVKHPSGTNYDKNRAEKEMLDLFNSLPNDIQEAFYYIKKDRNKLVKYYQENHATV